jgi:predicted dehydrogenase
MSKSLWLVGAGPMAQDYARVVTALGHDFEVVGRGAASAGAFEESTDHKVRQGGLSTALAATTAPQQAIVAVGVQDLARTALSLLEAGTQRLLIEKPGALRTDPLEEIVRVAAELEADVFIAYNRRFYASTMAARGFIEEDGGATACTFEFTEWSHIIEPLPTAPEVKAAWFLANSTHVCDLSFHLCGVPSDWRAWHDGALDWHPAAARFCGAGVTETGVLFSYNADWQAPGRWGVEVLTRRRRLIFRPMEQLQVVSLGSVRVEDVVLDDEVDKAFKPGLYRQTEAFLAADDRFLCTAAEQLRHFGIYREMAGHDAVPAS